jgi:hypothetical protein
MMVLIVASVVVSAVGVVMVMVYIVVVVSRFRPFVSLGVPRFGRMITFWSLWTFRSFGTLGSFWTPWPLFMRFAWVIVAVMLVSFVLVVGSRRSLVVVMELSAQVLVIFGLHQREHEAEQ